MSVTSAFTPRIGDAESLPGGRLSGVPARRAGADGGTKRTDVVVGVDVGGASAPKTQCVLPGEFAVESRS
jgi:hypothetical protein